MAGLLKSTLLLRLYRVGVLGCIIVLIHEQARWLQARQPSNISLKLARQYFAKANRVELLDPGQGLHLVTDSRGATVGCLLMTSPQMDHVRGYSGPNNVLIALDAQGVVIGIQILESGDTAEHVQKVKEDGAFSRSFIGWKPSDGMLPQVSGVSGATLTSLAIAEAVQQRLAGASPSLRFPAPVTLEEVRTLFPQAERIVPDEARLRALDGSGRLLGFVLRTSPQADNVSGYRGPTECLVSLDPGGRMVIGLSIRRSYDTESYVDQIRRAEPFLKMLVGRSLEELAAFQYPKEKIEGVSGATQTAQAVAEGLKRRLAVESQKRIDLKPWWPKPRDFALAGILAAALIMCFTPLRGQKKIRIAWQLLLVVYVGLINHDLLSLALFGGWIVNGLPFKAVPGLVLLSAAALLVPWSTRRQLYCHHICPHGAAQQLLGNISPRRLMPGRRMTRWLEMLPVFLLGFALLTLLFGWPFNLTQLEAFEAWSWRTAGIATLVIAILGLAASLFIPQAYCRYGCPTGAILNFVRSSGSSDRWGRRDWVALGFLGAGMLAVMGARAWPTAESDHEPLKFTGRTMGTTWSVKIHDELADPTLIEKAIGDQFEWVESMTSHWRTNTDLSIFNRTLSTNAMPVPWPVLSLVRRSVDISRASGGAYDITVGALVRLWGFGPGPKRTNPPLEVEITSVLPTIGWQKLEVLDGLLRKHHPALEVDLSSIAEGWAVDQVAELLDRRGYTNFLVEAGGEFRGRGRWNIGIEHPIRTCTLSNESLATSGTYRQNYQSGGRQYSHLIDPRTGRPVTHDTVSVSVRHRDCALADAWSTALNVLGADKGFLLAEDLGLAAQFVQELPGRPAEVRPTRGWAAREALSSQTLNKGRKRSRGG